MTFYYIIADSYDDFKDYLDRYEIPESEARKIELDEVPFIYRQNPIDIHYLHITKFAARVDECKSKFIDLQIALSQKVNIKTCIETNDGSVVSANISFLRL